MNYLLDVNVLIALSDPTHVHHQRVQRWFHAESRGWATCPLTENAWLRIVGHPRYPAVQGGPAILRPVLTQICAWPGHQFWADEISLRDEKVFPELSSAKHLTDLYLLALAVQHQAKLATLDQRIKPELLPGGSQAYFLIPD